MGVRGSGDWRRLQSRGAFEVGRSGARRPTPPFPLSPSPSPPLSSPSHPAPLLSPLSHSLTMPSGSLAIILEFYGTLRRA